MPSPMPSNVQTVECPGRQPKFASAARSSMSQHPQLGTPHEQTNSNPQWPNSVMVLALPSANKRAYSDLLTMWGRSHRLQIRSEGCPGRIMSTDKLPVFHALVIMVRLSRQRCPKTRSYSDLLTR